LRTLEPATTIVVSCRIGNTVAMFHSRGSTAASAPESISDTNAGDKDTTTPRARPVAPAMRRTKACETKKDSGASEKADNEEAGAEKARKK
jgi:hypothetical protein